jgi:hypothetical protein
MQSTRLNVDMCQPMSLVVTSCKYDNELSGSMKGREFLYHFSNYRLHKKDFAAWNSM